jgi:hypothetical protein
VINKGLDNENSKMAEQAHSSTETTELGDKENMQVMLFKLMKKMDSFGEQLNQNRIEMKQERERGRKEIKQEFQDMGEQLNTRIEQNRRETKQDMQEIVENVGNEKKKDIKEESENVTETQSEIIAKTDSKLSRSKNRRIRKMRLLKSPGINIRKFRKQQTKETRLGRVRKLSDREQIKCKRNAPTKHKSVKIKGKTKLTKCNKVTKDKVFRTNPSKVETKAFQSRHDKLERQQESNFVKRQKTCAELLRRLGEHGSNINSSSEEFNPPSEHLDEKQIHFQIVIRKFRHKIRLEMSNQESGTSQPLNHLVQNERNLTKGSDYVGQSKNRLSDAHKVRPSQVKSVIIHYNKKHDKTKMHSCLSPVFYSYGIS